MRAPTARALFAEGAREARRRLAAAIAIAAPPPKLTVSQWADRYRFIPKESAAEPGPWSTDRAPYQRGMMDAVSDPDVETVVYMTSSQVGKTEMINNVIGYFIDQDPSPILAVLPTVELAEAWSKDRLTPTIRDTPRLRDKVVEARSRDSGNTITHKRFPGGQLSIVGSNAPSSLASRPVRLVLCDEVDRFPASAGSEGDPVRLARRRTATFWNRKEVLTSSPTRKGLSRIEAEWMESDQRRYHVPCPECGEMQVLRWDALGGRGGLVWDHDEKGNPIYQSAKYRCEACETLIPEEKKGEMLARGRWIATYPERRKVGFHVWAGYSPWTTWPQIVEEWYTCFVGEPKQRIVIPERLQVFVNTLLGETWDEDGESINADALRARLEEYDAEIPTGVGILVAAVDVQADRVEAVVKGYGAGEESWLIEHAAIYGDPGTMKLWGEVMRLLDRRWKAASGRTLGIECMVVDSGGLHTEEVYNFTRPLIGRRVFSIKGASGPREIVGKMSKSERHRTRLFVVGVDSAKDTVLSRLRRRAPGPGFIHLPATVEDEYLEQLTAEVPVRVWRKGGWTREWKKTRERNEAWDLEVYALAALYILGPFVVKTLGDRAEALAREMVDGVDEDDAAKKRTRRVRGRGWVHAWKR